jgi:hypothetical protein
MGSAKFIGDAFPLFSNAAVNLRIERFARGDAIKKSVLVSDFLGGIHVLIIADAMRKINVVFFDREARMKGGFTPPVPPHRRHARLPALSTIAICSGVRL